MGRVLARLGSASTWLSVATNPTLATKLHTNLVEAMHRKLQFVVFSFCGIETECD